MRRSVFVAGAAVLVGGLLAATGPAVQAEARSAGPGLTVIGQGHTLYSGTVPLHTSGGNGNYVMTDPDHGGNQTCDMHNSTSGSCTLFTDPDNDWGDGTQGNRQTAAADAHYVAGMAYEYYDKVHGRAGVFDDGQGVVSRVHYGNNYTGVFWDAGGLTYGDGPGNQQPTISLDITGHQWAHAVTDVTAGLEFFGEPGGLNEATSDIFGTMIEFYANNATDVADYTIGEQVAAPSRYMYNPALDGASYSCWDSSVPAADPNYSSGVGDHFYFDLAEGTGVTPYGTSPVCNGAPAVTGIGRTKAEKIWYRALTAHFTPSTNYRAARAASLVAAAELYGQCGTEYRAVQAAWTAVNVSGSDGPC